MSNILIINGAKKFAHSNGQLNDTLTEVADGFLRDAGHDVKVVRTDGEYDIQAEVQNFLWADVVIWQMPGWWMGAPWTVKKYMDDVFTEGHGALYASDGRTRSDASKKYGSGGLIQGKKYMLSLTWNAPIEAFTEEDQFFHGVGVDGVYLPFHKANQFLGMEALPTFITNDVIKMPDVPRYIAEYRKHLAEIFCLTGCMLSGEMTMLTVIAEIRTRPGQHHRQAVLDQFAKIIPTVLEEAGCHGYAPMVDTAAGVSFQTTAPDSIVMVELWETVAHLEAHLQTPHMKAWSEAVKGDVLETHIRILENGV